MPACVPTRVSRFWNVRSLPDRKLKNEEASLKRSESGPSGVAQHELNKLYTRSKIRYVDTREKRSRVELAKERGQLVEKKLVINQAAFLRHSGTARWEGRRLDGEGQRRTIP